MCSSFLNLPVGIHFVVTRDVPLVRGMKLHLAFNKEHYLQPLSVRIFLLYFVSSVWKDFSVTCLLCFIVFYFHSITLVTVKTWGVFSRPFQCFT